MNTDDPKLTAFALGELDETERREVEALLQDDPAAAAEVAQLKNFSTMVRTVLAAESAPALGPVQRAELLATARGENPEEAIPENEKPAPTLHRRPVWIPSAIAATVMIAAWYGFLHQPFDRLSQMSPAPQAANNSGQLVDRNEWNAPEPHPTGDTLAPSDPAMPKLQPHFQGGVTTDANAVPMQRLAQTTDESAVTFKLQPAAEAPAAPAPQPTTSTRGMVLDGSITAAAKESRAAGEKRELTKNSPDDVKLRLESTIANPAPPPAAEEKRKQLEKEMSERLVTLDADSAEKPAAPSTRTAAKSAEPAKALGSTATLRREAPADPAAATSPARPVPASMAGRVGGMAGLGGLRKQRADAPIPSAPAAVPQEPALVVAKSESQLPSTPTSPTSFEDRDQPAERPEIRVAPHPFNTESYDAITDNPFLTAKENPLSTFSIDVDTASYANVRRFLTSGHLPPKGAVRIEELVNYFHYDYPQPKAGEPFSVNMEVAGCPWTPEHRLLRIGLKGREIPRDQRPPANLVFLIDVSGSMGSANKLPLVKESLRLLVDQLGEKDTVAIAVYAGNSGTVLEPTHDKAAIREALGRLEAGGSTNGGAGLKLAYELAKKSFDPEKTNRVILATDGDFNVGVTSQSELIDLITREAKSRVFLTVLGFGYGNLKDSTMEKLADKGNGNYAYIDTLAEGKKVLVEQMAGTLITIAKDVKIQIEFNPRQVSSYRLIGYENRLLAKEDFNNDKKDAGEIGAGHTVTALYELVPVNVKSPALTSVDPLKYQPNPAAKPAPAATPLDPSGGRTFTLDSANAYGGSTRITSDREAIAATKEAALQNELLTLKLRWKAPEADTSTLREIPLTDEGLTYEKSSKDFRWAASVAGFGMILRDSQYKGAASWDTIKELAEEGRGEDPAGYRAEFIQLLDRAASLKR